MSDLAAARTAARTLLVTMTGTAVPTWRAVWNGYSNRIEATTVAPLCTDETHDPTDGGLYDCCPEPVIETECPELATYLVALLNADRESGAA